MSLINGQKASTIPEIKIDGAPLDPLVKSDLQSAEVFTSISVPNSAMLRFKYGGDKQIAAGGFVIGSNISVNVAGRLDAALPLFSGQITALELDYSVGSGSQLIVRAIDKAHKLTKSNQPRIFKEMTSSDIVSEIVASAGISVGEVMPTTDLHAVMVKPNIDDWSFIQYLARRVGYIAYISEGLFTFTLPTPAEEGPGPYEDYAEPLVANQLVLGKNLIRFTGRVSANNQSNSVNLRGWTAEMLPLISEGVVETDSVINTNTSEMLAGQAGTTLFVIADPSFDDPDNGELYAESVGDYLAGEAYQMHGVAEGDGNLIAGDIATIAMAGEFFNGSYLISEATHMVSPDFGYQVEFALGGRRSSSLRTLVGADSSAMSRQIPGVAPGVVTSLADPEMMGRVQVQFAWLDETHVSDWARVTQLSLGEETGAALMPEVGTEVLCAFEQGDINRPYVIGCLWNSENRPASPELLVSDIGEVLQRRIVSQNFSVVLDDNPETLGVHIKDKEGTLLISINGVENSISIQATEGQISINGGTISIEALEELTLSAPSISISGDESVNISGATISIAGEGEVTIESASVSVDAPEISLA